MKTNCSALLFFASDVNCCLPSALSARLCSRQSCARAGRGASLRRSHCVSTPLRCSLSRPHRGTRDVRFALSARTTAMRMLTKCAARTAVKAALLSVAEAHRSPPERSFAEGLLVFAEAKTIHTTSSRQVVSGGSDRWGAEQRSSAVGAHSALRHLTRCGCPSGVNAVNKASSAARPLGEQRREVGGVPHDRPSVSARRIPPAATRATPITP